MDEARRTRTERDTFGPVEVPAERLWGAQTQRSLEHFRISGERVPPALVRPPVGVKKGAARSPPGSEISQRGFQAESKAQTFR